MAFKDGMAAVAKVLKVIAVLGAGVCFFMGLADRAFLIGTFMAVILFLLFWTPAWIIKKFIQ